MKTCKGKKGFTQTPCSLRSSAWVGNGQGSGLAPLWGCSSAFQTISQRRSPLSWWNPPKTVTISTPWQFPWWHFGGAWDETDTTAVWFSQGEERGRVWRGRRLTPKCQSSCFLQHRHLSTLQSPAENQLLTGVSHRRICLFNYRKKVFRPLLCTRNYIRFW